MMTRNEFLEQILGFSKPWYIESALQSADKVTIKLNYPKGTKFVCPHCGTECSTFDSKWKEYRHLDWWQYKTIIKVKIPRIKCCKGKSTVDIPWLRKGSKFTQGDAPKQRSAKIKRKFFGRLNKFSRQYLVYSASIRTHTRKFVTDDGEFAAAFL